LETPKLPPLNLEELGVAPLDLPSNAELAKELTEELLGEDSLPSPVTSPMRFTDDETSLSALLSLQPPPISENRKLEVPLSPPQSARRVRFGSILATDNHRFPLPMPIDEPKMEPPEESLLEALARSDAQQLERELAQEQLQEADSTMRVPIPVMDFSLPKPPWKLTENDKEAFKDVASWAGLAAKKWRGVSSIQIGLNWHPWTAEEAVIPKETIESDDSLTELLSETDLEAAEAEFLNTFMTLCIKEEEVDETLPYGEFGKSAVETEVGYPEEKPVRPLPKQPNSNPRMEKSFDELIRKRKHAAGTKGASRPEKKNKETATNDGFNAASSLDAFLNTRGSSPTKFPERAGQPSVIQAKPKAATPKPVAEPQSTASFPAPKLPSNLSAAFFIISTTLLAQRPLFRAIKTLYPAAHLIERDFSAPLVGDDSIFSHADNDDADLILSPKTGLILTTVQRLRQRSSLPGESAVFNSGKEVKERIKRVCRRYERLLIFVTSPSKMSSKSDWEVIAEFFGFVAQLVENCNVVPRVIEGGDEVVAKWVVAVMLPHKYSLIEDETTWEQFMRKAGCNAFACQVVVRECKQAGGLRWFLALNGEERRKRFEGVVGSRVWGRIEMALLGWGEAQNI
jgi:hypothetical protein